MNMDKKDFNGVLERIMREEMIATTVKNKRILKERLNYSIGEEIRLKDLEFLIKFNINDTRNLLDKVKNPYSIPNTAVTHNGLFHADDVCGFVTLRMLNPNIQIIRTNDITKIDLSDKIVFDIGGGEFDHHDRNHLQYRDDDHLFPYASFGLLWKKYGHLVMGSQELADVYDNKFVKYIDQTDNTSTPNLVSSIVSSFNISWEEKGDNYENFLKAVSFIEIGMRRQIESLKALSKATESIDKQTEFRDDDILVLKTFVPYGEALKDSSIKFVIYPSLREGYNAMIVSDTVENGRIPRAYFPTNWYGKAGEELKSIVGYGINFCHNAGYLIQGESKEDVIRACKESLKP